MAVQWRPRTYSTVYLETAQNFEQTNGTGDRIDTTYITGNWTHSWLPRLTSVMDFRYQEDSFDDVATDREDDIIRFGIHLNYEIRRWLRLSTGYRYNERDSTTFTFDYKQNIFDIISAQITL